MRKEEMTNKKMFDTSRTIAKLLFERNTYPWEVLPKINEFILSLGGMLPEEEYRRVGKAIWIHNSVKLPPSVCLQDYVIICKGAKIRHSAFIRGNVIVGENAVVGNSTELKNTILFDEVQVPHYNYVGDSILGYKSHMGAASLTSNVKSDKSLVKIHAEDGDIETGLKKMGAILGEEVEIGCSAVLNPGTVIGSHASIYPLSCVRGCVDADSIYKKQGEIVQRMAGEMG